ncbi:DUF5325 family protein [Bacillus carboniphilus]|uniref:DUF5325 family protein n=1 Tax=Bacillus carboniphilus TaxID=86663 RepID=A0ABY9JWY2_9BACI|nr:DUF5325 family protein [Bacillus carboniphilus]WLR43304.1 DUF5325 family protein [Bacillus carboniphilus]
MKKINGLLLFLAFLGATFMVATGIAVGEGSVLGVIASIIGIIVVFGSGFTYKKKLREQGRL